MTMSPKVIHREQKGRWETALGRHYFLIIFYAISLVMLLETNGGPMNVKLAQNVRMPAHLDFKMSDLAAVRIPANPDIPKSGFPKIRNAGYPEIRTQRCQNIRKCIFNMNIGFANIQKPSCSDISKPVCIYMYIRKSGCSKIPKSSYPNDAFTTCISKSEHSSVRTTLYKLSPEYIRERNEIRFFLTECVH